MTLTTRVFITGPITGETPFNLALRAILAGALR